MRTNHIATALRSILLWLCPCALLVGCAAPPPATLAPTRIVPTLFPTNAAVAPPPVSPTPEQDSGWVEGGVGIAVRHLRVPEQPGQPAFPVIVVRLDPANVRLRVVYTPEHPRTLRQWFADAQPLLAVNGGFFTEQYQSAALVVSDGVVSGGSYSGFGGMLAIAPDGNVSLRSLRDQPYDPHEPLMQAIQSFPMLLFPGGAPAAIDDDGAFARRTAVAIDRSGHLLLIVSPASGFTLRGLANWLAGSDLDIERALNFDGGSSTGMFLSVGALNEQIDSFGPLPMVLLVEPKP